MASTVSNHDQRAKTAFELEAGMRLHLIGIGGAGISAIAHVLIGRGFVVTGSDLEASEFTAAVQAAGVTVHIGHDRRHVTGSDAVVISSAIPEHNPELQAAREQGLPILKRFDVVGQLMVGKVGIAVAGSHGKTTTCGMVGQILMEAELDPTIIVGGALPALASNGRHGAGPHFLVEADEYDYMFLGLRPEVAVLTNVEHDHPDIFPTEAAYVQAFLDFVKLLPVRGRIIAGTDDKNVRKLLKQIGLPASQTTTFGLEPPRSSTAADRHLMAAALQPNRLGGTDFVLEVNGDTIVLVRLRVPGRHNVLNALASLAVATDLGIDISTACRALIAFGGVSRRFQVKGIVGDVVHVDDYAHHPTELRVTLAAARQRFPGRRLWAIWQPHTYSRTRLLLDSFVTSFADADRVLALDIYRSREQDDLEIQTGDVLARMDHAYACHEPTIEAAASHLLSRVRPGDVILTLGAGDGHRVGDLVLRGIAERTGQPIETPAAAGK